MKFLLQIVLFVIDVCAVSYKELALVIFFWFFGFYEMTI